MHLRDEIENRSVNIVEKHVLGEWRMATQSCDATPDGKSWNFKLYYFSKFNLNCFFIILKFQTFWFWASTAF